MELTDSQQEKLIKHRTKEIRSIKIAFGVAAFSALAVGYLGYDALWKFAYGYQDRALGSVALGSIYTVLSTLSLLGGYKDLDNINKRQTEREIEFSNRLKVQISHPS